MLRQANGDLWEEVAGNHEAAEAAIEKVRGHVIYADVLAGKAAWQDYIGNALSDVAAGVAAERAQLPDTVLAEIAGACAKASLVAQRLSYIEARRRRMQPTLVEDLQPRQAPEEKTEAQTRSEVAELIQQAGHKLKKRRCEKFSWLVCGNCKKKRRIEAGTKPWRERCPRAIEDTATPRAPPESQPQRQRNNFDDSEAGLEE